MTIDVGRAFADLVLTELDRHTRAAAKGEAAPKGEMESDGTVPGRPVDPEAAKKEILAIVQEELDWDGKAGDPNESVAALETALADMFDADVEILWDGQSSLTLHVEGEEPAPLTVDYLGELLEALAKQSGDGDQAGEDDESATEGGGDGKLPTGKSPAGERAWRGAVVDAHGNLHAADGEDGGRFVKKGGAAASAAKAAGKAVAKTAKGGSGGSGGTSPGKGGGHRPAAELATRAGGRAGARRTAKAVGESFTAGTGKRVKVKGNKDGTFEVGKRKKKMSGKKAATLMIASWLAFGLAAGFLGAMFPPVAGVVAAAGALTEIGILLKYLKDH